MTAIRTLGYLTLDAGPVETIEAAATAGFKSVGIRICGRRLADPYPQIIGNRHAIAEIRRRIADTGMSLSNVSAYHVYPDVGVNDMRRVIDTVVDLGARIMVANSYDPDENAYVDKLRTYCEHGAPAGLRIAVEFMRYSGVKTIQDASRVVAAVGTQNIGILVDALHLARSGGTPADIGKVDARSIAFAQLCDGKRLDGEVTDDVLRVEARTGRLYPGDGNLPLREFLAALPPGTEIEYEVPRQDLGLLTLTERAKVAFSAFQTYLDSPQGKT